MTMIVLAGQMRKPDYRWACQECGHIFRTTKAAERAAFGDNGCPKCGGSDIDQMPYDNAKALQKGGDPKSALA